MHNCLITRGIYMCFIRFIGPAYRSRGQFGAAFGARASERRQRDVIPGLGGSHGR